MYLPSDINLGGLEYHGWPSSKHFSTSPPRGSFCCPTEIWLSRTIYVTGTMTSVLPVMTSHTGGCDQQRLEDGSWAGIRLWLQSFPLSCPLPGSLVMTHQLVYRVELHSKSILWWQCVLTMGTHHVSYSFLWYLVTHKTVLKCFNKTDIHLYTPFFFYLSIKVSLQIIGYVSFTFFFALLLALILCFLCCGNTPVPCSTAASLQVDILIGVTIKIPVNTLPYICGGVPDIILVMGEMKESP